MAWLLQNAWRHLQRVSKSAREEDKTGLLKGRETYGLENDGGAKHKVFEEARGHVATPALQSCLLTDVRRNQNTARMRYCRANGWVREENAITVAIITQISLPLYLSLLFNTRINHHHVHYAASHRTQGRAKRTNMILSGKENNAVYRAGTTIALFNK